MTENQQRINVNQNELQKIKQAFKDNDILLKAMRALFLGLGVTSEEKQLIKSTFADDELFTLVADRFYPTLKKDTAIGQVQDIWLGAETMIFGVARDTIAQAILYKDRSAKMVQKALGLLRNVDGEAPRVRYEPTEVVNDELGIELLARNQYIRHIESQIYFLKVIAETKEDSPKEIERKSAVNSTK